MTLGPVASRATRPVPRGDVVGAVGWLGRYPVKSTAGESLARAEVTRRGLAYDREWAVYTAAGYIASGKSSRRFRKVEGLMRWRSTMPETAGDPVPVLHDPDGVTWRVDDPSAATALTAAFGQPLTPRLETTVSHYDDCGVHLVTRSAIRRTEQLVGDQVDARRMRANLILDTDDTGFVEDAWIGSELAIGPEVVLRLGPGMPRCVMVDQPQVDVPAERPILHALGRHHDVLLGLQAEVVRTGTITIGDQARMTPAP